MPARIAMRPGQAWNVAACLYLDNCDYQPKQSDTNRLESDL